MLSDIAMASMKSLCQQVHNRRALQSCGSCRASWGHFLDSDSKGHRVVNYQRAFEGCKNFAAIQQ